MANNNPTPAKIKTPWSDLFPDKQVELYDHRSMESKLKSKAEKLKMETERCAKMRKISDDTFAEMTAKIDKLNEKIKSAVTPLEVAVVTQAVIAHKKGLTGEAATSRILEEAWSWLSQRKIVVDYLRKHGQADLAERLERAILLVETSKLKELTKRHTLEKN